MHSDSTLNLFSKYLWKTSEENIIQDPDRRQSFE